MSAPRRGRHHARTWTRSTASRHIRLCWQSGAPRRPIAGPPFLRRSWVMEIRLDGRSAIVTGGSKGLGLAIAGEYAKSGADVAILARDQGALAEAKQKISAGAPGRKVIAISCDVSKAA